jgi:hypothetical protein
MRTIHPIWSVGEEFVKGLLSDCLAHTPFAPISMSLGNRSRFHTFRPPRYPKRRTRLGIRIGPVHSPLRGADNLTRLRVFGGEPVRLLVFQLPIPLSCCALLGARAFEDLPEAVPGLATGLELDFDNFGKSRLVPDGNHFDTHGGAINWALESWGPGALSWDEEDEELERALLGKILAQWKADKRSVLSEKRVTFRSRPRDISS